MHQVCFAYKQRSLGNESSDGDLAGHRVISSGLHACTRETDSSDLMSLANVDSYMFVSAIKCRGTVLSGSREVRANLDARSCFTSAIRASGLAMLVIIRPACVIEQVDRDMG